MDCPSLANAVERFIDLGRSEASPSVVVDVAIGLMRLSEDERQAAILEMCRSLIEREARALSAHLIGLVSEKLNREPIVEAATLAIALCGAEEAPQLFPTGGVDNAE